MNKVIDGLYSKKVLKVMNEMLDDFILSENLKVELIDLAVKSSGLIHIEIPKLSFI